jgi:D-alanyl-D-alanine carboxypeptidase
MKQILQSFLLTTLILASSANDIKAQITSEFQYDLDNQIIVENTPGILATVISKEKQIDWSGAAGYADKETKLELSPNQTFRVASVTKNFIELAFGKPKLKV